MALQADGISKIASLLPLAAPPPRILRGSLRGSSRRIRSSNAASGTIGGRLTDQRQIGALSVSSQAALVLFGLLAFVAGLASALQTTMNGALGRSIGDPVGAALWSFATGTVVVVLIYVLRGGGLSQASLAQAPPWSLLGGVMGAVMVLSVIIAAPRIGLMSALLAIILGQAIMSMMLDAAGIWGEPRAITTQRMVAIGLLIAGFWGSRG
jgi:bacterial/archaeal transporter family-2 protein